MQKRESSRISKRGIDLAFEQNLSAMRVTRLSTCDSGLVFRNKAKNVLAAKLFIPPGQPFWARFGKSGQKQKN
ncbi:hypothetical protein [Rufibacter sp. XAAS-G3-1]|uniref:hypothetical protein n=1 Tax=Rufibacter sp. XAAS-G3-1 TaxID=2729134 RepID=UPI0015E6C13B|nr:hypothetical protein [Rufibacter sp. XAAS-G3-1]